MSCPSVGDPMSSTTSRSLLRLVFTELFTWDLNRSVLRIPSLTEALRLWSPAFQALGHGSPLQYSCLEDPRGQRSLVGYSPWGYRESDTTKGLTLTQAWGTSRALIIPMVRCQPLSPQIQLSTWKTTRPCTLAPVHSLLCSSHMSDRKD